MDATDVRNTSPDARASLTIAVADDVAEIQTLAKIWLTELGHQVLCAGNGRELIQWCESRRVDIVLTDVVMPETDGFEVIRQVRARHPAIKIVSMSGGAPVMSMDQCLHIARALGADAVLRKPFNRAQLVDVVDAVIKA